MATLMWQSVMSWNQSEAEQCLIPIYFLPNLAVLTFYAWTGSKTSSPFRSWCMHTQCHPFLLLSSFRVMPSAIMTFWTRAIHGSWQNRPCPSSWRTGPLLWWIVKYAFCHFACSWQFLLWCGWKYKISPVLDPPLWWGLKFSQNSL